MSSSTMSHPCPLDTSESESVFAMNQFGVCTLQTRYDLRPQRLSGYHRVTLNSDLPFNSAFKFELM